MSRGLRFKEGIHLVCAVDLHVRDIGVVRWELHREILERVVLRHIGWDRWWFECEEKWGAFEC